MLGWKPKILNTKSDKAIAKLLGLNRLNNFEMEDKVTLDFLAIFVPSNDTLIPDQSLKQESGTKNGGGCVGKTEIVSSPESRWGATLNTHFTLWERFTKDSVWKILSWTQANFIHEIKLTNQNNLKYKISSGTEVWISYTYRF